MSTTIDQLSCAILTAADSGYAQEIAPFNRAVQHAPDLVVCATTVHDITAAVKHARTNGLRVQVQGAGHGAYSGMNGGLLITTKRMDAVRVDPITRIAHIGAGTRWGKVVAAAAEHGLFPITGSSPDVGVAGYLLGGGLGPLVRSHGYSSDHLVGATVVTGNGDVVDTDQHPELLWALRGGKYTGAVVAELRVRLVELRTLYAGSLFYAEEHIEQAFGHWVQWTATAHPAVSTSVAVVNFPPFEFIPPPFRGRRLLVLHFTYPGPQAEGVRLAEPFRTCAPVHLDDLRTMPTTDVDKIHNDPRDPVPVKTGGLMLERLDEACAKAFLAHTHGGPFMAMELRHLGEAARRDVDEGSAVGGRQAAFALGYVAVDPSTFDTAVVEADARLRQALQPWTHAETNINFMGKARSAEHLATAWSTDTFQRLQRVRATYDPHGTLAGA